MARTRTLADLQAEIRSRADVDDDFLGDTELNRYINASIAKLYRLLVDVNKDYYLSEQTIAVVSGTATYALPTDYWRTVGMDVQDGSYWIKLTRFNWSERNMFQSSSQKRLTRYRIMGSNVRLAPTPSWSGTIRHWYISVPPVLDPVTVTSWDGMAGFEEYAVIDAVMCIRLKQEEDVTADAAQLAALEQQIRMSASERDDAEPARVRDVEAELLTRYLYLEES